MIRSLQKKKVSKKLDLIRHGQEYGKSDSIRFIYTVNNARHYLAGIAAFVIWGFFSLPLRAISDYSVGAILYFRILFSCLVLIVIVFGFKRAELKRNLAVLRSYSPGQRNITILLTMAGGA